MSGAVVATGAVNLIDSQPVLTTDPMGTQTKTVYTETATERIVKSWIDWGQNSGTPAPVQIVREDLARGYIEHWTQGYSSGQMLSLTREYLDYAGRVIEQDRYFTMSGVGIGSGYGDAWDRTKPDLSNGKFYRTSFEYDIRGGQNKTTNAVGTITVTEFDGLGRPTATKIGTSASLVYVSDQQYDNGGVGDGTITQVRLFPSGPTSTTGTRADDRVTQNYYDWRGWLVASKAGALLNANGTPNPGGELEETNRPLVYYTLDNLGRQTWSGIYDGDALTITIGTDGVPVKPAAGRLRALTRTEFDAEGRVFRTSAFSIDQASGGDPTAGKSESEILALPALRSRTWYDKHGDVIKTVAPGGLVTKVFYDGAGRAISQFVTDGRTDSTWAHAGAVDDDIVIEQVETQYDKNGNPVFVTSKQRLHDESDARLGALTSDLGSTTAARGRTTYVTNWYDAAGRLTDTVNWGTNTDAHSSINGAPIPYPTRDDGQRIDANNVRWTVPDGNDAWLMTNYRYNPAGQLAWITDPRGIRTHKVYDAAGRLEGMTEGYEDGIPGRTSDGNQDDRVTHYYYDGADRLTWSSPKVRGLGKNIGARRTQYLYGTGAGSEQPAQIMYPRGDNGLFGNYKVGDKPVGGYEERFEYNALGEKITQIDRSYAFHRYTYDVLGRLTEDKVTYEPEDPQNDKSALMDGGVRAKQYQYDVLGRIIVATSRGPENPSYHGNDANMIVARLVNQVKREYDGFGNLKAEYQEHTANTPASASSPCVQYNYAVANDGSRLTSLVYPNGREVSYDYGATGSLNDRISRVAAIKEGSATLEAYGYLGLGQVVWRSRPIAGTNKSLELAYDDGTHTAEGGYSGLDRFGRIAEQKWMKRVEGGSATIADDFKYWYDGDGNMLAKQDMFASYFSEIYQYDGSTAATAYNLLNQMRCYQRGTISGTTAGGRPNAISGTERSDQTWSLVSGDTWVDRKRTSSEPAVRYDGREVQQRGIPDDGTSSGNSLSSDTPMLFVRYDAWGQLGRYQTANRHVYTTSSGGMYPTYTTHTEYQNRQSTYFAYDALGRRISETNDLYFDAVGNIIEERTPTGTVSAQYVYSADGGGVVFRERDNDSNPATLEERLYPITDAQGSTTSLFNGSGTWVESYVYTPDGERWVWGPEFVPASNSPYRTPEGSYDWRPAYKGGRYDGSSLFYLNEKEMDSTAGGPMVEDGNAYWDARNAVAMERIRNSEVELHGAWKFWTEAAKWTSTVAFTAATFGTYAAVLGFARGAVTFAATAGVGAAVGGGVVYARGSSVASGAFIGAELSTAIGAFSPRLAAMAVTRTGGLAAQSVRAASQGALRLAGAARAFGSGFIRGISQPAGLSLSSFLDVGAGAALRVIRGMRAGFAEMGAVRGLRFVRAAESSEEMGVQLGRKFLAEESGLNLRETDWVNPFESASGRNKGFDDVLVDADGDFWIAEYKGGAGALDEVSGQMGEVWTRDVIDRMIQNAGENPWGKKLLDAWNAKNLRGITVSVADPNTISVVKLRAYNVGMWIMSATLRLEYVDLRKLEPALQIYSQTAPGIVEMLKDEPDKVPQRRWATLVSSYEAIGLYRYVLGAEDTECRGTLSKSVAACIELFRLRGTQEAFPVLDLVIDTSKPKGDPDRARLTRRHEPGTKDYSLTNSKGAYWYVCLALGIGEEEAARELAAMIWDPPEADYIGPRSVVCTPNQQALAYALRHYLAENQDAALATVSRVRTLPNDYYGMQAALLKALVHRDAERFLEGLNTLLLKHETLSRREAWNPTLYVCVPAMGLTSLAVAKGLVGVDQLPSSVYLPVAWFTHGMP